MKYSKCAWFAPVSIVINFILYNVYSELLSMYTVQYYEAGQTFYGQEAVELLKRNNIISTIGNIVPIALILIISSVLFLIAFNKIDQYTKAICIPLILVPCVLFPFTNAVGSLLNCIVFYIFEDQFASGAAREIGFIISNIVIAVLSYFIVSTYLKRIDNSTFENYSDNNNFSNPNASDAVNSLYATSSKSKAVAGLLCFFLGVFGIHRFYVGKVGTGVLWLLTGGLFGIGAFIDFFIIIFGGFKDSNAQPLS